MENKLSKTNQRSESFLSRISAWVFSKLQSGMFGRFFTSYDKTNEKFESGLRKRKKSDDSKKTRRTIAKALESSPFVSVTPKIADFLLRVSLRDYGIALLTLAIFTCGIFFMQDLTHIFSSSLMFLITGIAMGVIALPMLLSKKSLSRSLIQSKATYMLLFKFLGASEENYTASADQSIHTSPSIALISGMILCVISYFIGPLWTIGIIFIIYFAYQVLLTPEMGIIIVILALPFNSYLIMSVMGLYVSFCYAIKCVVGKRTFKFEYIDFWVIVMMLVLVYSVFVSFDFYSSMKDMLYMLCLILSFFMVSNLIRSKEWYKRCILAICTSSTVASAIAIAQFILGKLEIVWDGFAPFATIHTRVCSTFQNADAFAIYLVACIPFLVLFLTSNKSSARVIGLISGAICVTALILTYSKAGFVGALVMILLMLLILHRNTMYIPIFGGIILFALEYALPIQLFDMLSNIVTFPYNAHAYRLDLFHSGIDLILEHPFGVGVGQSSFTEAYSSLFANGSATNLGNLYFQIAISCGIIGLILFVITVVVFLKLCFSYCAKTKSKMHRINALAGFCGVVGVLSAGFLCYAWQDKTILSAVCIFAALTFAYIKLDREIYRAPRHELVDYLAASIDIDVDKDATYEKVAKRKYVRTPKQKPSSKKDEAGSLSHIKNNEIDPFIND